MMLNRRFKMALLSMSLLLLGSLLSTGAAFAGENKKTPGMNPNKLLNVAHRGASGFAPEHTIASYKLGEEMKGNYIEIDLQMTKDGKLIAMHDESVDRTTNGTGLVKNYTLQQLKELDAGSWFNEKNPNKANPAYEGMKVPTLEEVIQTFGKDARYYIETKSPDVYPGMEEELLRILEKYNLTGVNERSSNVLIQSFSQESLLKIHELNPNLPLIQLISYKEPAAISEEELQRLNDYAVGVGMSSSKIDENYVQQVRNAGLLIHPYTVNEKEDMERLLNWGVTGMFTNYPDRLNDVIHGQ
ncbi:MAG: glycerophosphodiester phosphodiesterase [Anaerobacillus sp.]